MVDVSQDVIINTDDCGTLRGIEIRALKKNEEVIETLGERVLGRVALNDVINPLNEEVIVSSGEEIREDAVEKINQLPIESIEVRSALTCEAKHGICAKCYGRNLSTGKMVQIGEAVVHWRTWYTAYLAYLPHGGYCGEHLRREQDHRAL